MWLCGVVAGMRELSCEHLPLRLLFGWQWADSDSGFCVLGAASAMYCIVWPIAVFRVCVEDSRYAPHPTATPRTRCLACAHPSAVQVLPRHGHYCCAGGLASPAPGWLQ